MAFNEEAWIKISNIIGFETRKDAFLQGFYMAYNKLNPVEQKTEVNLDKLYPKYNCPSCGDWFHMPYKFCKCDTME